MDIGVIYLLFAFILLIFSAVKDIKKTKQALKASGKIALAVFPVLFFIFILMGVVSAFVSKETIASWLGADSGVLGILIGEVVGEVAYGAFRKAIEIIIAVFVIIGLIQVWVGPQTLSKLFGREAGWKGLVLASTIPLFLGGSLLTMLPLVKTLRDKGASIACVMAFIAAWGGKVPLLPLEIEFLGWRFSILRTFLTIPFAILMGLLGQFVLENWQNRSFVGTKGIT